MLYELVRPLLFSLDAENAHDATLASLHLAGRLLPAGEPLQARPVQVMGISFLNRVGLAAGLDKNGEAIDGLARLGFGNHGVDALVSNVRAARYRGVLGINIGKNFDTPIEHAADDYLACLEKVYPLASYVTVNISSPNTKNLRQLQGESELDALLGALKAAQTRLADQHGRYVPLTLKIAPDLESPQIVNIADALRRHRIDGVIATNTTLARDKVQGIRYADQQGDLSGAPVFEASNRVIAELAHALQGELPIIGAGGILDGRQARAKLEAGAQLVQLYSGLIYRGPCLVRECVAATRGG